MCLPGLFTAGIEMGIPWPSLRGYATLIVATVKSGGSRPGTALMLLAASNASFWLVMGCGSSG